MSARSATTALRAAALLALAVAVHAAPAAAGGGTDNCTGFIDSIPATITAQGVWCVRAKLQQVKSHNYAITIAVPNVTLDCNGYAVRADKAFFSIGGIRAEGVLNATVRNCRVLGFDYGILLTGGGGHLVEDNLVRGSLQRGIGVEGDGNLVRRNRVLDTGGAYVQPRAIVAGGDVLDNVVDGVVSTTPVPQPIGIVVDRPGSLVRGNIVRGVTGYLSISLQHMGTIARDNHVVSGSAGVGTAIATNGNSYCSGNTMQGFAQAANCAQLAANLHD